MDFSFSPEQLDIRNKTIQFAREELNADWTAHEAASEFPRDLWKKCADFGIQSLAVPAKYGGREDTDILTAMIVMEALGYGCKDNGLPFGLNAQMWTVMLPIVEYGTEEQKNRYLPGLCDGSLIGVHAVTEPEAGSDAYSLKSQAQKTEGGYVLNGTKKFITLGPVADVALTFATIDPELERWGITVFLVDLDSEGVHVSENREKMGLRTIPIGEIHFKDCFVPEENRLGPEGAGVSISVGSLEYERLSILSSQVGAMQRQLEETIKYANERHQFGQPIGKFESVSNRITEMKLRLETARLLLYKTAWLKREGQSARMEASLLKLHISESFLLSSMDSIRVHGGEGYMSDTGIERDLRDAVGGVIYAGTSDIQRKIISRLLDL